MDTNRFDFTRTVLTHPTYRGRKVHVPPLFESLQKDGSNKAEAISRDGRSRVSTIERIHQFFHHQLVENPRTPVPEFNTANRFFTSGTEVKFVIPVNDAPIRYQVVPIELEKGKSWKQLQPPIATDEPQSWTEYTGPFQLNSTCLARAFATIPNRRDSTIAEAHFFAGLRTPSATGPDLPERTHDGGTAGSAHTQLTHVRDEW